MKEEYKKRIEYLRNFLVNRPEYAVYDGDSDYAGDWVEQENRANDEIAEKTQKEIKRLERLIKNIN